jgi:hypothetical protein
MESRDISILIEPIKHHLYLLIHWKQILEKNSVLWEDTVDICDGISRFLSDRIVQGPSMVIPALVGNHWPGETWHFRS